MCRTTQCNDLCDKRAPQISQARDEVQDCMCFGAGRAPTPICLGTLLCWLYSCKADAAHLVLGFTHGFRTHYDGQQVHIISGNNLCSIQGMVGIVRQKHQKELESGHISGPHKSLPMPNFQESSMGI